MGLSFQREQHDGQGAMVTANVVDRKDLIIYLTSHALLLGPEESRQYRVQVTLPRDRDTWSIVLTSIASIPDRIIEFCGLPKECSSDPHKILVTSRKYTSWSTDDRFDQTTFDLLPVTPIDPDLFFESVCYENEDYKHTLIMHTAEIDESELPVEWTEPLRYVLEKQEEVENNEEFNDVKVFQVDFTYFELVLDGISVQCRRGANDCMFRIFAIQDDETGETAGWLQESFEDDFDDDQELLSLEDAWSAMMSVE